ncbi:MAG: AroM family protein [Thermomicrobiales bacterium]|nr:AroM family protein [Thermomicrobiales bacterium]
MPRIGFATIAQSPRDDVVPAMMEFLPLGTEFFEAGCLDDLSRDEINMLAPDEGEVGIVARLKEGGSTLLSHRKITPRMQSCVDHLVNERKVDLVVILCGADWSEITADIPIVNPGRLFPGVIQGLAGGKKLGIIKPSAGQIQNEQQRYQSMGISAVVTAASPYGGDERLTLARQAAELLQSEDCDMVWMTCIGMDAAMRGIVADITGKPVVLANSLLARLTAELTTSHSPIS